MAIYICIKSYNNDSFVYAMSVNPLAFHLQHHFTSGEPFDAAPARSWVRNTNGRGSASPWHAMVIDNNDMMI